MVKLLTESGSVHLCLTMGKGSIKWVMDLLLEGLCHYRVILYVSKKNVCFLLETVWNEVPTQHLLHSGE